MTRHLHRALVAPTLALAVCIAVAGCGDSSHPGTKPTAWAHSVCSALDTWKNDLGTRTEKVKTDSTPQATAADQRALLAAFLGDTVTMTDTMLQRLDAAGAPAVSHGPQLAKALRDKLAEARTTLADAQQRATELPDDPQAFADRAQSLGADIEGAGKKLDEGLNGLDKQYRSPSLNRAFANDPACKALKA